MTLVAEIINQAYRESNLIPIGVDVTAAEELEGLKRLQSIVKAVIGNEAGEELQPWDIPVRFADYRGGVTATEPWPNSRLLCRLTAPVTVDLPARGLRDGARLGVQDLSSNFATHNLTLDGNGYLIDGATTLVLNTDDVNSEWFFRADLGQWLIVSALAVDEEMPFPQEFDELFIALLALRLNPRHGTETRPETASTVQRGITMMRAKYRQTQAMPSEIGIQMRTRDLMGANFDTGMIG